MTLLRGKVRDAGFVGDDEGDEERHERVVLAKKRLLGEYHEGLLLRVERTNNVCDRVVVQSDIAQNLTQIGTVIAVVRIAQTIE